MARLGGDEFAIIGTGLRDVSEVEDLAARIIQTVAEPFCDRRLSAGNRRQCRDRGRHRRQQPCRRPAARRRHRALLGKKEGAARSPLFTPDMESHCRHAGRWSTIFCSRSTAIRWSCCFNRWLRLRTDRSKGSRRCCGGTIRHADGSCRTRSSGLAEEIGFIDRLGAWILRQACT